MCKFRIIAECFLFLNFKRTLMYFSAQASVKIDTYSNSLLFFLNFNSNLNLKQIIAWKFQ
jgi:hypothetical protein